ncbi:S-methyl-5-thioribose kinase [Pseudovibrio sp. SPO723]|uniref:S-methyl-5-thioribose kinase n=1 Tax=Nesiotobacter zosterae TaxID=392721 RepID=UPI0029C353E7|nr:S-methyl-5-thioribose kinase [Pseudovibrio sp. SPO723]MDX5594578.1 S-methyl-5-thioribose kinase [Pseudovibrio sp. SPO723]
MSVEAPLGYKIQTVETLPHYLISKLPPALNLGGAPETWEVKEVGDGNLNLVFIVSGSMKTIVVKQAVPYVRAAGESWPLPLTRAFFEFNGLVEERRYAGDTVPEAYFYDEQMALFAMEYITPHVILRKELIAGKKFPKLAKHIGEFLAQTLFHTSDLGLESAQKKELVQRFCVNTDLCRITEDLIFTEPFFDAPRNNWTSPQLDDAIKALWSDQEVIQVAMKYKLKFMSEAQALLHGDLHSGSIMVTEDETKVIDPEFGFYGPMAFDIGNYIGNLFFAFYAQPGHRASAGEVEDYQSWLLEQIVETWGVFEQTFRTLWTNKQKGEAYPRSIYQDGINGDAFLKAAQDDFFRTLFIDTLVNAGLEMHRRIIGFAGVADFKEIEDADLRASLETRALKLARQLMVAPESFSGFADVNAYAKQC